MSSKSNLKKHQKLCHIVKIKDFDGYGFNLHSEKNKPGQYIGRVDSNSPAEMAGLKEGDRIIQVNGVDIGVETHRQVVQRIKAIQCEVLLLVIDPKYELNETKDSNKTSEMKLHTSELNVLVNKNEVDDSQKTENNSNKAEEILSRNLNNKENSTKIDRNSLKNENAVVEKVDMMKSDKSEKNTATMPFESNKNFNTMDGDNKCTNSNNGKNLEPKLTDSLETNPKINLKMTAGELRAKLLSKKKYDPKKDTLDFLKKYNIIEEL